MADVNASSRKSLIGKGTVLHSQAREIIWNVYRFFEQQGVTCKNETSAKTAAATGVSASTVKRIVSSAATESPTAARSLFDTPGKKRQKASPITGLDEFDMSVVRATVAEIYREDTSQPKYPTVSLVLEKLKDKIGFNGGSTSLRAIMKKLGMRYGKINQRQFYIEKPEVVALRRRYLRQVKSLRKNPDQTFIYLDETWVNQHHAKEKMWHSNEIRGRKVPLGKGQRLILVHAGSKDGFITNGKLLFRSKGKSTDYHDDMNGEHFREWFEKQLLPNIPANSIIVMDNAPYHSVELEKAPTSATRKADMIDWLDRHGIGHAKDLLKPELYELIKLHKPVRKKYVIDTIAALHGHTIVRLPPYHCELNPIELIWAQVKKYVRLHNSTFTLTEVHALTEAAINQVTPENWQKTIEHVLKIEDEYWETDHLIEDIVEPLIVNVSDSEESDLEEEELDFHP